MQHGESRLVPSNVKTVPGHTLVRDVVAIMRDQRISCVLIHEDSERIIGIVTERDIVHKFTLLDNSEKLDKNINALMTRPVYFVRSDRMFEDIVELHNKYGLRHFPVLAMPEPYKTNLMGIVTATDLFRQYMLHVERMVDSKPEPQQPNPKAVILSPGAPERLDTLRDTLISFGVEARVETKWKSHLDNLDELDEVLIHDLDYVDAATNSVIIKALKTSTRTSILLTSEMKLLKPFRNHLDASKHIFVKPIDLSYIHWLISTHHRQP